MNAFQSELLSPDARNQNLQYFYEIENSIVHWVTLLLGASVGSILFVFRFRAGGKAYGLCDRTKPNSNELPHEQLFVPITFQIFLHNHYLTSKLI